MTSPLLPSWLARLVRRQPAPPVEMLGPYADVVLPLADRAEALHQQWFEYTALIADSEKLANAAAIHRWQVAAMARTLERVAPPAELALDHVRLIEAFQLASRAAQLLSSGSRYHNANALCEGQVLLTESRARRLKALAPLRSLLAARPRTAADLASPVAPSPPVADSNGPSPSEADSTPDRGGPDNGAQPEPTLETGEPSAREDG
ncbi:MAG: hypothetical protein M3O34_01935 [Chloroflexota bacterium]|nr:hypothetical protein [Chloroflexota bacterium]